MAVQLDKPTIERAFERVGELLQRQRKHAVISVYGGTAILLTVDRSRTTQDVDAVVRAEHGEVLSAARQVASELGLPRSWLNESVSVYTSVEGHLDKTETHWFGNYPSWAGQPGLEVRVASASYLLAMKTASNRLQPSDLEDIERLARETGFTSTEAIATNLRRYFPSHNQSAEMAAAIRDIVRRLGS